jgi:ABC-2 type transport system permease protein
MALLRDTWLVFLRAMGQSLRNPIWTFVGLAQPVFFLFLFGPLLKRISHVSGFGDTNAYVVLVPGLLVQLGLYGAAMVGFGIIGEWRSGVIERMRVTPVSRAALLLGRSLRDVAAIITQSVIMILLAMTMGLSVSLGGALVTIALIALLGFAFSAASYAIGLTLQSEDALAPLMNFVVLPIMLLSGLLLPMTLAPAWLRNIARIDPLRYTVDAARSLFHGSMASTEVLEGFLVTGGLAVVCVLLGVRTFQRSQA